MGNKETCIDPYLSRFPLYSAILTLWGKTNGPTDGRKKPLIEMHVCIYKKTHRQTDRQTESTQTESRETEGQTERLSDRLNYTYLLFSH